jgi:hypothetical protein
LVIVPPEGSTITPVSCPFWICAVVEGREQIYKTTTISAGSGPKDAPTVLLTSFDRSKYKRKTVTNGERVKLDKLTPTSLDYSIPRPWSIF